MNRIRKRFINRDSDLTFIFTLTSSGLIHKTIIVDNISECDVSFIDLHQEARDFYDEQVKELSIQKLIDGIKKQLTYGREIV